ncbi:Uncharacterized protein TCM_004255 [Theobroma cacao]|uniref:Uncharacterized protein n=1 Tax=Theobroma cacao TaxID=3641 RepID=A0A061DRB0_THECC|nr:Uncharacterized protein TCM_004255 [Theobroma cacao]
MKEASFKIVLAFCEFKLSKKFYEPIRLLLCTACFTVTTTHQINLILAFPQLVIAEDSMRGRDCRCKL